MTEPISSATILAFLKSIFPGLVGAAVAVWYKRHDIDLRNLTTIQKIVVFFVAMGALIVGVTISHYGGGALNEMLNIKPASFTADMIKASLGLASLKIIDAYMKNVDGILAMIFGRLRDKVGDRFK